MIYNSQNPNTKTARKFSFFINSTKIIATLGVLILASGLSVDILAQTSKELRVNTKSKIELRKSLKQTLKNDPSKIESTKLKPSSKDNLVTENIEGFEVNFDLKAKKIKMKNKTKGDLSVGIPNSDKVTWVDVVDDKVIYTSIDQKTETIVEAVDGGFRQIINIKDGSAPNQYDFLLELVIGESLVVNEDGSAMIIQALTQKEIKEKEELQKTAPKDLIIPNYKIKTFIAKPWAKDANNKDLPTNYSVVNSNTLRQTIDFQDAVFPVVADPLFCNSYISYTYWIPFRKTSWSLAVILTDCGRLKGGTWNLNDAWKETLDKTENKCVKRSYTGLRCVQWIWDKAYGTSMYWSMYDQFDCHHSYFIAAVLEAEYNLELSRPNVGIVDTLKAKCNP